jgi:hypothetical protein
MAQTKEQTISLLTSPKELEEHELPDKELF